MDLPTPLSARRMACCQRQGKLPHQSGDHEVANLFLPLSQGPSQYLALLINVIFYD